MTNLTLTHLRFTATATSDIELGRYYAGNNLRNALASVMRRATCPETHRRGKPSPEHAGSCPACWLLASDVEPGRVRRSYAVQPPMPAKQYLPKDATFSFGLTLFGEEIQFFPYFILAFNEVGRLGFGKGRGTFVVNSIEAVNPLTQQREMVLASGEAMVKVPQLKVKIADIAPLITQWQEDQSDELTIQFHTPVRLITAGKLCKSPDFAVFFRRLLQRTDELCRQFANEPRRPKEAVAHLYQLADQVRLVDAGNHWVELHSWSGRSQRKEAISGFIGWAKYRTTDWGELLPWLLFGQGIQVGKLTVKGHGVYSIEHAALPAYWEAQPSKPTLSAL